MKEFQICGLGNAIVDIFVEVNEKEFGSLGFERGGMTTDLEQKPYVRYEVQQFRYSKDNARKLGEGRIRTVRGVGYCMGRG